MADTFYAVPKPWMPKLTVMVTENEVIADHAARGTFLFSDDGLGCRSFALDVITAAKAVDIEVPDGQLDRAEQRMRYMTDWPDRLVREDNILALCAFVLAVPMIAAAGDWVQWRGVETSHRIKYLASPGAWHLYCGRTVPMTRPGMVRFDVLPEGMFAQGTVGRRPHCDVCTDNSWTLQPLAELTRYVEDLGTALMGCSVLKPVPPTVFWTPCGNPVRRWFRRGGNSRSERIATRCGVCPDPTDEDDR